MRLRRSAIGLLVTSGFNLFAAGDVAHPTGAARRCLRSDRDGLLVGLKQLRCNSYTIHVYVIIICGHRFTALTGAARDRTPCLGGSAQWDSVVLRDFRLKAASYLAAKF